MQVLKPYAATMDFRQDKLLVEVLRAAISTVAPAMPEMDDPSLQLLMTSYRDAMGERTVHETISNAKLTLDRHVGGFRAMYSSVLGSCLMSQLDKLQGREAAWPALDSDSPELVPDAVIERRLVIDELTRLVDPEADEGVATFDLLLCHALGRRPTSLRENPLRPAVFFHAIGMCWSKASESNRDELLVLRRYGPLLAERVVKAYPAMTAVLRKGLDAPKPPSANLLMRRDNGAGSLYSRRNAPVSVEAAPAKAETARSATETTASLDATIAWINQQFAKTLTDNAIPASIRLGLAALQLPLLRYSMHAKGQAGSLNPALELLVSDVSKPMAWKRFKGDSSTAAALETHLAVIAEMLKRDPGDAARDSLMFDHLRSQLLALLASQPAFEKPAEATSAHSAQV